MEFLLSKVEGCSPTTSLSKNSMAGVLENLLNTFFTEHFQRKLLGAVSLCCCDRTLGKVSKNSCPAGIYRYSWRQSCVFIVNLKRFHTLFWCFHCWLWASKCWLRILKRGFEHYNWLLNPSKPIKFQKCWEDRHNVKTQLYIFNIFPLLFTLMPIVYSFNGR